MNPPLRIATRGSKLALWQADHVAALLRPVIPDREISPVLVHTSGDMSPEAQLTGMGGIGVFTKEVQHAVLGGRADLAVHSLKDLPTIPVPGLVLAAVPARGPVGDVLVSPKYGRFERLPHAARIATGSTRRRAQALQRRPDIQLADIRGNVETRLRILEEDGLDGLILAHAGLERLGLSSVISEVLDPAWMLPAVGQGALGIECRADDEVTQTYLRAIDHAESRHAVLAERAFLRSLGGGCMLPIAAWARDSAGIIQLTGAVYSPDGKQSLRDDHAGMAADAEIIGQVLAGRLLARGARGLLEP